MKIECTSCGCTWDSDEGFYHTPTGEIVQPCRICRCDTASIYYINHADVIRAKKRASYHAQLEAKREYYREYRRQQRATAG